MHIMLRVLSARRNKHGGGMGLFRYKWFYSNYPPNVRLSANLSISIIFHILLEHHEHKDVVLFIAFHQALEEIPPTARKRQVVLGEVSPPHWF